MESVERDRESTEVSDVDRGGSDDPLQWFKSHGATIKQHIVKNLVGNHIVRGRELVVT